MTQPTEPTRPDDSGANGDRGRPPFALEDPLIRFDARVLDPTVAVRLPDGEAPSPTVYVGDTLLITATSNDDARELLAFLEEAVKGSRLPRESGMYPRHRPLQPSTCLLQENGRAFPPNYLHHSWRDFLYWDTELEAG